MGYPERAPASLPLKRGQLIGVEDAVEFLGLLVNDRKSLAQLPSFWQA